MPIDLVGKLHRTVFVEGCDPRYHEDLAQMLLNKCGAVEAWDSTPQRLTVLFAKMDSVPNAVAFNGTSFGGTLKKLVIWAGNKAPPSGHEQLALAGPQGSSADGGIGGGRGDDAAAAAAKKRRLEFLNSLSGGGEGDAGGPAAGPGMTPAERRYRLLTMSYRQLKALVTLTEAGLAAVDSKIETGTAQLAAMDALAQRLTDTAAQQKTADDALMLSLQQEVLVGAAERRRRNRSPTSAA